MSELHGSSAIESYIRFWDNFNKSSEKQTNEAAKYGEHKVIANADRIKMDIAASINTLFESTNGLVITDIHEIIAYGFDLFKGNPDDRIEPDSWVEYNSMAYQRKIQDELKALAER